MTRITILLLLLLIGSFSGRATTLALMNLDDLTEESSAVVYGKVLGSRTEWNSAHTLIYTVYTVVPMEYLKGRLGNSIELYEPGGTLDGMQLSVPGAPVFAAGEEAVLFLWTDPQGRHMVTGFEQGSFPVRTDPKTGLRTLTRGVGLGSARTARAAVSPSSPILPLFFEQIRSSLSKTRKTEPNQ